MNFLKSELRKNYRSKRGLLSEKEIHILSNEIVKNLTQHFDFQKGENVLVFLPIKKMKEVDTTDFIRKLWQKEVCVYLPKVFGEGMKIIAYTPETLVSKNSWEIEEPLGNNWVNIPLDKVIVPVLYADSFGNRVGYGKGFYDRFFASLEHQPTKIGINYYPPNECIMDVEDTDYPLDYLVTPSDLFDFRDSPKSIK